MSSKHTKFNWLLKHMKCFGTIPRNQHFKSLTWWSCFCLSWICMLLAENLGFWAFAGLGLMLFEARCCLLGTYFWVPFCALMPVNACSHLQLVTVCQPHGTDVCNSLFTDSQWQCHHTVCVTDLSWQKALESWMWLSSFPAPRQLRNYNMGKPVRRKSLKSKIVFRRLLFTPFSIQYHFPTKQL